MRGVMSPNKYVENDLSDLKSWNEDFLCPFVKFRIFRYLKMFV